MQLTLISELITINLRVMIIYFEYRVNDDCRISIGLIVKVNYMSITNLIVQFINGKLIIGFYFDQLWIKEINLLLLLLLLLGAC